MASLIKGIEVTLHQRTQIGTDAFNSPVYETAPVVVKNVLVSPSAPSEILSENQMNGKRMECELSIPKGDSHIWENSVVEFFGKKWHTFGPVQEWIGELVPLDWNRKVKAACYE